MADTIVNTPAREREVYDSGSDMASWVVALAIIVVLVLGAVYLLPRLASNAAPPTATPSNINITLPNGSGGTEGPAGGTSGSGSTGGATDGTSGSTQ